MYSVQVYCLGLIQYTVYRELHISGEQYKHYLGKTTKSVTSDAVLVSKKILVKFTKKKKKV